MTSKSNETLLCATQLRRTVTLLARSLRPKLQDQGISTAKLSVLGHLRISGDMTPTQLAAREGVKIQSLTRLLAELEAEKRIKRKQHPVDGRQSVLSLTHSSLKILGSAALQAEQSLAQVIAIALTATEVAQLQSACLLLERLVHALPTGWADTALTAHKPHNTKE